MCSTRTWVTKMTPATCQPPGFCFFASVVFLNLFLLNSVIAAEGDGQLFQLSPHHLSKNASFVEGQKALNVESATACVWAKATYFRRPSVVMSFVPTTGPDDVHLSLGVVPRGLLLRQGKGVWAAPVGVVPLCWYLFCLSVTSHKVSVFLDGKQLLHVDAATPYLSGRPKVLVGGGQPWPEVRPTTFGLFTPSSDSWDVLRDRDVTSTSSSVAGSFAGDFFEPRVWNTELSEQELTAAATCGNMREPIAVSWKRMGTNITRDTMDLNEPCSKREFAYVILATSMRYEENVQVCGRFNSRLISPSGVAQHSTLLQDAEVFKDACGNGRRVMWVGNEGGTCPALTSSGQESTGCEAQGVCAGCELPTIPTKRLFTLRGLCSVEEADLVFVLASSPPPAGVSPSVPQPYFQGVERYSIRTRQEEDGGKEVAWELRDDATGRLLASITDDLPVGVRQWRVETSLCGARAGQVIKASLSACGESETTCGTGECVPLSRRCDGYPDCTDGYDEEDCQAVRPPPSYLAVAPPPPTPSQVELEFEVSRVPSTSPLTILLHVTMTWSDPRLSFANIQPSHDTPIPEDSPMWIPRLLILAPDIAAPSGVVSPKGADGGREERSAALTAYTTANPLPDPRDTPARDTLYPGANTTLKLSEYVLQPFDCNFDLSFYPFDVHECILPLVLVPHGAQHARLVIGPNNARYTGQVGLKDFNVDKVEVENRDATVGGIVHSGVVLRLQMSRRPAYLMLAVVLPSFILLAISTTSLWMSSTSKTPSRMIVSCCVTGAFLLLWVLSALTSPSTGGVKALDVWLCFCTMHALLHDITHVVIDIFSGRDSGAAQLFSRVVSRPVSRMREVKPIESGSIYDSLMVKSSSQEEDDWTAGYWITFIARVVSPVLVVLFNATFWPFVLYFNVNPLP